MSEPLTMPIGQLGSSAVADLQKTYPGIVVDQGSGTVTASTRLLERHPFLQEVFANAIPRSGVTSTSDQLDVGSIGRQAIMSNPVLAVANAMRDAGAHLADTVGQRKTEVDSNLTYAIGALGNECHKPAGWRGFLRRPRADFLGVVWLSNEGRGADPNRKWVIEARGEQAFAFFHDVVKPLAQQFGAKVELTMVSEQPGKEGFSSDYLDE